MNFPILLAKDCVKTELKGKKRLKNGHPPNSIAKNLTLSSNVVEKLYPDENFPK